MGAAFTLGPTSIALVLLLACVCLRYILRYTFSDLVLYPFVLTRRASAGVTKTPNQEPCRNLPHTGHYVVTPRRTRLHVRSVLPPEETSIVAERCLPAKV